jgi:hypothetical protein
VHIYSTNILETRAHLLFKHFRNTCTLTLQTFKKNHIHFNFCVCHTENQQGKEMSVNILSRFQAGLPRSCGLIPGVDRYFSFIPAFTPARGSPSFLSSRYKFFFSPLLNLSGTQVTSHLYLLLILRMLGAMPTLRRASLYRDE